MLVFFFRASLAADDDTEPKCGTSKAPSLESWHSYSLDSCCSQFYFWPLGWRVMPASRSFPAGILGTSGSRRPSLSGRYSVLVSFGNTANSLRAARTDFTSPVTALIGSGWRRTPLESSTNSAVSLLEQEKHCQHAKEEKREAQPCHVVHRNLGIPHQCQHHQKQNESDAATADNSVFRMAFKDAPEYERVEGKQSYASCRV